MVIVVKFGTFWTVYCPDCSWQEGPVSDWKEAEKLRTRHTCKPEAVRIKLRASTHALR